MSVSLVVHCAVNEDYVIPVRFNKNRILFGPGFCPMSAVHVSLRKNHRIFAS